MNRGFIAILLALSFCISVTPLSAGQTPDVVSSRCRVDPLIPPSLADSVLPSTTIIIDTSGSMNEHAYQEREVQWVHQSDGISRRAYAGFNSTNNYYGYFDSKLYYSYNDTGGFFYEDDSSGGWSGNFLNWVSTHRIDVVRKVLTGGVYDNSTSTYTVSRTDEDDYRGKYHVYNATGKVRDLNGNDNFVVPEGYRKELGFEQFNANDTLAIYVVDSIDTGTDIEMWNVQNVSDSSFELKIFSEKRYGLLDLVGYRMRLSLFCYDDDGDFHNGGKILNYMTSDPNEISDVINNVNMLATSSWTPLAESLHTVVGYLQQEAGVSDIGPLYESDSYIANKGDSTDPFFFGGNINSTIPCTQQNVILITDGESTMDENVPDEFKGIAALAGNDSDYSGLPNNGTGYLVDIAYWAHTNDLRPDEDDLPGKQSLNLYTIFAFGTGSQLLKDAAKYGGFIDRNDNGLPDIGEYNDDGGDIPDNYFEAATGSELENALISTFSGILNRVSSGSAASVVNTQREGVGFLLQSVYWPELADKDGNLVNWAGDVYAYWLDDEGGLFLDDGSKPGYLDSTDSKVNVWYDTNAAPNRARACVNGTIVDGACVDGVVKEIDAVKHLWSVSSWLNKKELQTSAQREYDKNTDGRYIMTWSDDGDGKVQSGEYVSFTSENFTSDLLDSAVVEWLRGADGELRSRKILSNIDTDEEVVWRLGDVINSSPTVVGRPSENFDLIWDDDTYTKFYTEYYNRRTMVYFGGNDGMLHAINAGFYSETDKAFCRSISTNGSCMADDGFELGAEMWAYVPYNLHPHLSCLANKQYQHQYYVDLKPRVFEVQIWKEENDPDHPYGWGTILVTGFNFGGDGKQSLEFDSQYFGSSFSVFDITNPEKAPVFLGEFTYDDYTFGYALNQPTVVAVKDSADNKHWYMLMGTGPQDPSGASTQKAGVVVVPLAKLVDQDTNQANTSFPLRLDKNTFKPGMDKIGVITLSDSNSAMGTGFSAVDYDFDFFVDMMYYGTVVTPNKGGMTGGVHRLKIEAEPDPSKWERKEMTDTGGPMTGGINVGFKDKNVWVYFGTGKFWDVSDKTDVRTQWMYGIMEPKRTDSDAYNFSTIPVGNLLDVTDFYVRPNNGLGELFCKSTNGTECLPSGVVTVDDLEVYIRDTQKYDGWKRELEAEGERVIVEPSLFGGIANFVASVPSNDYCVSGGSSKLYALYYLTGTAWKENVFGGESGDYVPFTADLGQGIASRPSLHIGKEEGVMLYFQNNNGEIISLAQPVLPTSLIKSGKGGWHTQDVD